MKWDSRRGADPLGQERCGVSSNSKISAKSLRRITAAIARAPVFNTFVRVAAKNGASRTNESERARGMEKNERVSKGKGKCSVYF